MRQITICHAVVVMMRCCVLARTLTHFRIYNAFSMTIARLSCVFHCMIGILYSCSTIVKQLCEIKCLQNVSSFSLFFLFLSRFSFQFALFLHSVPIMSILFVLLILSRLCQLWLGYVAVSLSRWDSLPNVAIRFVWVVHHLIILLKVFYVSVMICILDFAHEIS